jgi:hypothetical protein
MIGRSGGNLDSVAHIGDSPITKRAVRGMHHGNRLADTDSAARLDKKFDTHGDIDDLCGIELSRSQTPYDIPNAVEAHRINNTRTAREHRYSKWCDGK